MYVKFILLHAQRSFRTKCLRSFAISNLPPACLSDPSSLCLLHLTCTCLPSVPSLSWVQGLGTSAFFFLEITPQISSRPVCPIFQSQLKPHFLRASLTVQCEIVSWSCSVFSTSWSSPEQLPPANPCCLQICLLRVSSVWALWVRASPLSIHCCSSQCLEECLD